MQLHNIKKNRFNRKAKQVGRGGTRGKTSGRGTKGQNARSGRKKRPEMRDFIKKIPKLRGRGKNSLTSIQEKAKVIDISLLASKFSSGEKVNQLTLLQKGLIEKRSGRIPKVKILGSNNLGKELVIEKLLVSGTAKKSIESAGGKVL